MKPEVYRSVVKVLFDDILKSASSGVALEGATLRLVKFFEAEIASANRKCARLLRFNREMRKKLEELTDAKS